MPTRRLKLTIAYRGTAYHGWQTQLLNPTWKGPRPKPGHGIPTVQETLRRAVEKVVGHPINLVGSSRTDAGVHAKGQVAHFDTAKVQIPPESLRLAINHQLPDDILVRRAEHVADSFDAILSTTAKRYQYVIWHALDRPPFFGDRVWHRHRWRPLDWDAVAAAARHLVGTHDFASFCKPGHFRENTTRTVHGIDVSIRLPRVVIGVEGSGFLWHMVRIMVGTLVDVGLGQFRPEDVPAMLAARDRRAAGGTAPGSGLYLQWIRFDRGEGEEGTSGRGGEGVRG